jgi:transposase
MTAESDTLDMAGSAGTAPEAARRLKHYPLALKHRIVEETFAPGQSVSIVARRHDVNANLVFEWRKQYRQGILGKGKRRERLPGPAPAAGAEQALLRIGVIGQDRSLLPAAGEPFDLPSRPRTADPPPGRAAAAGRIEIVLSNGFKVQVEGEVDERALTRVLVTIRELA